MATLKDIIVGDVEKLQKQTEAQRNAERTNMIRNVKKGRQLVGKAETIEAAKFVARGLCDAKMFTDSDGMIQVWASYGFITCEFDPWIAFQRVGLAQDKYEYVNIITQPELPVETVQDIDAIIDLIIDNKMSPDGLGEKIASIVGQPVLFEVWGIL